MGKDNIETKEPDKMKEIMSGPIDTPLTEEEEAIFDKLEKGKDDQVVEEPEPKEPVDKEHETKDKPEPKEPEPKEPVKEEPIPEDSVKRLDAELAKPFGQENLKDFSPREKAYFWQMRRDRSKKQEAQNELDIVKFQNLKLQAALNAKVPLTEPEKDELADILKDRQDDDFLTVAEAKKLSAMIKQKPVESKADPMIGAAIVRANKQFLKLCDKEAADKYDDYAEVSEVANDLIGNNPEYLNQLRIAMDNGENPAIVMYHITKGDPNFERLLPIAQAKLTAKGFKTPASKAERVTEVETKIKENTTKPKTSAHVGGGGGSTDGMTAEQFLAMSDREFSKLPKATRDKLMRKFGV